MQEPLESFLKGVAEDTWKEFTRDALLYVIASVVFSLLVGITLTLLAGPLSVGFIQLVRRGRRGEPVKWNDIFSGFDHFVSSFIAFVIIMVGAFIGSLMLIIPGLLFAMFTMFTMHVIAYENVGAFDAIGRSFAIVKANFINVLILMIVVGVLQTVGSGVLVGLLLTTPLALIAMTSAFERLSSHSPAIEASASQPSAM